MSSITTTSGSQYYDAGNLQFYNPAFLATASPYEYHYAKFMSSTTSNPVTSTCLYCGNTGTNVNVRGGVECAGCGVPR